MKIAALIFDKITVLDIVGPTELLSWVPGSEIVWVGKEIGPIRAAPTGLAITVERTLDEVSSADILIIPGGPGVRLLLQDDKVLDWVRKVHATTKWTTSVCTGSLPLRRDLLRETRGPAGEDSDVRRRVIRHRHGALAGRQDRRR